MFVFFFFKQKTAYEMRISDWSSDVCSSDLGRCGPSRIVELHALQFPRRPRRSLRADVAQRPAQRRTRYSNLVVSHALPADRPARAQLRQRRRAPSIAQQPIGPRRRLLIQRSEEHTSELQSLMRISYAVFCLKKQNKNTSITHSQSTTHKSYYIT